MSIAISEYVIKSKSLRTVTDVHADRIWFCCRRPGIAPRAVHMGLVVDRAAQRRYFSTFFRCTLVSIIPPTFHTHSWITGGWTVGPIKAAVHPIATAGKKSSWRRRNLMAERGGGVCPLQRTCYSTLIK